MDKLVADYLSETASIAAEMPLGPVVNVIELLRETRESGGTIYVIGNGGSGSTASHFACDLGKGTRVSHLPPLKVVSLTDNTALITSWINDVSYEAVFVEQLRPLLRDGDVLIVISVHGGAGRGAVNAWSQNLRPAIDLARERNAKIVGLTGFDGGQFPELCDVTVIVPSNDIGQVESFHLILNHLMTSCLLRAEHAGHA